MNMTQVAEKLLEENTRLDAGDEPKSAKVALNTLQDNTAGQPGLADRLPGRGILRPDQRKSRAVLAFVFIALLAGVALLPFASRSPLG